MKQSNFKIYSKQRSSYNNNVRCQFPNVGLFLKKVIHSFKYRTSRAYLKGSLI